MTLIGELRSRGVAGVVAPACPFCDRVVRLPRGRDGLRCCMSCWKQAHAKPLRPLRQGRRHGPTHRQRRVVVQRLRQARPARPSGRRCRALPELHAAPDRDLLIVQAGQAVLPGRDRFATLQELHRQATGRTLLGVRTEACRQPPHLRRRAVVQGLWIKGHLHRMPTRPATARSHRNRWPVSDVLQSTTPRPIAPVTGAVQSDRGTASESVLPALGPKRSTSSSSAPEAPSARRSSPWWLPWPPPTRRPDSTG